jgi:hypothetical protein
MRASPAVFPAEYESPGATAFKIDDLHRGMEVFSTAPV